MFRPLVYLVAVLIVGLTACVHSEEGNGQTTVLLAGTSWAVDRVVGLDLVDGSKPMIKFGTNSTTRGTSGCNRFTGTVRIEGMSITFDSLTTTKRACKRDLMKQEQAIFAGLRSIVRFRIDERDGLELLDDNQQPRLRLTRIAE